MNLFAESKKVLDKDGKVNPLGPYGKQKLTGREVSTYFRRNKVSDAQIKKAVEVALDLGGADTIARKEIKKFYGDKILKSKEVQTALRYANESVNLDESKLTLSTPMYNAIMKMGLSQLMKKHDAYVNKKETDKEHTTLSTPSAGFGSEVSKLIKKNASKLKRILPEEVELDEDAIMSAPQKNMSKIKPMLTKLASKHKKVDVSFGTHSKGRFVDDNNINFKGDKKDIDMLMKDMQKNKPLMKMMEETEWLDENYRQLAQKGMGTETKKDARVGLELDYYDSKGNKHMGKITKKTATGYTVQDDKTRKTHTFKFHDRVQAKKLLQKTAKLSDIIKKNTIKKGKFAGYMTDASSPEQQAAIAIAKKKEKNVMETYREMWENGQKYAPQLDEEVANITVDPRNKISKSADQNKHAMAISKNAKRMGLKSAMMGKHVRIKGNKKAVNDFLRVVIGKSTYGDPTEKDMTTPQIDKMLNKDLK